MVAPDLPRDHAFGLGESDEAKADASKGKLRAGLQGQYQ
jgi:hypothetical protein